jgi:hypothetical protein
MRSADATCRTAEQGKRPCRARGSWACSRPELGSWNVISDTMSDPDSNLCTNLYINDIIIQLSIVNSVKSASLNGIRFTFELTFAETLYSKAD